MKTADQILDELGIAYRSLGTGKLLTTCPKCSHLRRKKRERCLSVLVDGEGVLWNCHHCGWHGGRFYDREDARPNRHHGFRGPENLHRNSRSVRDLYR